MDRGAWRAAVHRVAESQSRLSSYAQLMTCAYVVEQTLKLTSSLRKKHAWAARGYPLRPPEDVMETGEKHPRDEAGPPGEEMLNVSALLSSCPGPLRLLLQLGGIQRKEPAPS